MTYDLQESERTPAAPALTWSRFLQVGDRVSDKRLGLDQNVGYRWSGALPSMDELRGLAGEVTAPRLNVAWLGAAMLGTGLIGAFRARSKKTS